MLDKILKGFVSGVNWYTNQKVLKKNIATLMDLPQGQEISNDIYNVRMWTNYEFAIECSKKLIETMDNRSYLTHLMANALVANFNAHGKEEPDPLSIQEARLEVMFDEEILQTYDMYGKDFVDIFGPMQEVIYLEPLKQRCVGFVKVFQKYRNDEYKEFGEVLSNTDFINFSRIDVDELLSEKGYEEARKNGIKKVALQNYSMIRFNLGDSKVQEKITYKDLDFLCNAFNIVMEIHKNKEKLYQLEVNGGFMKEMWRVMEQGKTVDEKIFLLKQYGKEVLDKVKNSAEELMFHA